MSSRSADLSLFLCLCSVHEFRMDYTTTVHHRLAWLFEYVARPRTRGLGRRGKHKNADPSFAVPATGLPHSPSPSPSPSPEPFKQTLSRAVSIHPICTTIMVHAARGQKQQVERGIGKGLADYPMGWRSGGESPFLPPFPQPVTGQEVWAVWANISQCSSVVV